MSKRSILNSVAAILILVSGAGVASAEVTFEWVTVGNPGNAADPLNSGTTPGIGSVDDIYLIAKHEVTNDQYAEFLNAVAATDTNGLYNASMGSAVRGGITQNGSSGSFTYAATTNMGNKPVNYVSFLDAMRFVNWLHNGQPTGLQDASTTEDGIYAISDGLSEVAGVDARFFIPSENEWYKAAYHHPSADGGDSDDYWLYSTASNNLPTIATANATGDISNPGTGVANYQRGADWNGQNGNVTTVGSAGAGSSSFYGTSDQGGNVWEWTEEVPNGSSRRALGGAWSNTGNNLQSSWVLDLDPAFEGDFIGFRVARTVMTQEPPILAPAPHDILKNRYISIDPRGAGGANVGQNLDIRVTLSSTLVSGVTAIDSAWWAGAPDANCISLVGPTLPATPPNWDACPTLHLTGCPIIPTSTYEIVVVDGENVSAPRLTAHTQAKPAQNKWWGDTVGSFDADAGAWTPPQGTSNFDDVNAAIKTFQDPGKVPGCGNPPCNATHVTVSDLHPALVLTAPLFGVPNRLINFDDVFLAIKGFQGAEYPGRDIHLCGDP